MAIVAAILALVGTAVGAGVKADKARKDGLALQKQYEAQREALREGRSTDLLTYLNFDKQEDAKLVVGVLIGMVVIFGLILWYKKQKR